VGVVAPRGCDPPALSENETTPESRAVVAAPGAAGEGAGPACAKIRTDRRAVCRPDQMNVVPVAGASLPGSMSIQNRVVISSQIAFPWTLDALRSSRLVSRQLKVLAKYWVRPRVRRFRRFDVHDRLRLGADVVTNCAFHLGCHFMRLLDGQIRINRDVDLNPVAPA